MRKLLVLISFLLLLPSAAQAQSGCTGQAPANTWCGNNSGSQGLPGFHTLTPGSIILNGGSVLANTGTSPAVGTSSSNPVLGIPGTSTGTISFAGASGGTVLVTPQTTAGSPTLTLPNTSGTFAVGASSPIVLSATTGNLTCPTCVTGAGGALINGTTPTSGYSNTQILSSNGSVLSAYSVTGTVNVVLSTGATMTSPTIGTPSITTPTLHTSLLFAGLSTGTATIVPQSAAGTPTLTLPTGTGTFAVTASSPVVLSATTGNLTCPTCVTSSGGGAITGQAPIAVSAAGVVSITGAAGQVLAGATPAFTATPVLGVAGTTVGSIGFQNASTGTETITPAAGALGSGVATLPAGTYNIVGDTLTQALTNKTYNGLTVSTTTGTFTLANGKTFVVNNALTFSGTDSTTMTFPSTNGTIAALNIADQTVTGGANVTTQSLSTGNVTIDCGSRPLQSITNGGAFTITAPASDGSCILLVTNNASASTISFSGFSVGTNTGDTLTTTNTSKFMISIARVNGSSTYSVKALQ